jgi:probable rRNA maturation factor
MHIKVEIAEDYDKWNKCSEINEDLIAKFAHNILARYSNFAKVKEIELSILLADNQVMQKLNHKFRKKDKATNVLSFPDCDIDFRHLLEFEVDLNYMYLGDIAFGYEIIETESRSKNVSFLDHFKHLLVHSILHLLGYDHNEEEDTEIMQVLEIQILQEFKIASPY